MNLFTNNRNFRKEVKIAIAVITFLFSLYLIPFVIAHSSAGTLADVSQDNYRFRNDDGSETTATWKAATNTPITVAPGSNLRIRLDMHVATNNMYIDVTPTLQFSSDAGGDCTAGTWTNIGLQAGGEVWRLVASSNFVDGDATIQQITAGGFVVGGIYESSQTGGTASLDSGNVKDDTEYEWSIEANSASLTTYYFRTVTGGTAYGAYTQCAALTVATDSLPTWSNPLVDNPTPNPGQTVIHNVTWNDDNFLSYATLEVNSTGACDTALNVSSTTLSGSPDTADLSWQVPNACEGKTIGWRQYANDSANQWNVTDLQTYDVQNIAPTITHDSPLNGTYFNYAPYFNGTCSDAGVGLNTTWTNLTEYPDYTTTSPYNFTNTSGALTEKIYSVRISCNDSANNIATLDFYFTFDVTAPTATINTANNTNTTDATPDINITLTDNIGSAINYTFYINDTANKTGAVDNNSATNIPMDTLADGLYRIKVQATDNASNSANSSEKWITIDTTAPQFSEDKDDAGASVVEGVIVNISVYWQDTTIGLDTAIFRHNVSGWDNISTCALSGTNKWCNKTINTAGHAGEYVCWNQYANDTVGNLNTSMSQTAHCFSVTTPNAAPYSVVINDIDGKSNNSYTIDTKPEINFTVIDKEETSLSCELWVNGSIGYGYNGSVLNDTATILSINQTLTNSFYTIYVNCSDGSLINSSDSWWFTVDTIKPQINIDYPSNNSNLSITWINITGTASDTNTDSVVINNSHFGTNQGDYASWNFTNSSLVEETYIVKITANDSAENENSSVLIFTIDRTSPVISHDSPENATYFNYAPYFNGTCSDTNPDSIWTNLSKYDIIDTESPYNFTNTSALTEGIYSVRISCNDSANNTATSDFYFTFDVTEPVVSLNLPEDNFNTSSQIIDFNFTATDNISLTMNCSLYINDTYQKSNSSTNNNTLTNLQETDITEGSHNWTIKCKDSAENQGTSATQDFYIDLTDPTDNDPTNANHLQNSGATIGWILTDEYASGYYYVKRNETLQNSSTAWQNDANLNIWVNTTTLGIWNYTIFYNDSVGHSNSDEVIITISSDSPPSVTLNSPVHYYNSSSADIEFNCTANDDLNLENVSLYGNWTTVWHLNETNNTPINNAPVIFSKTISDGIYVWNCYACDNISQCNFDSANHTLNVDTVYPTFSNYLRNPDPAPNEDEHVQVNVTITELNIDTVILEWDGTTNYTVTTNNGYEYYFTVLSGNYTAHDSVTYYWYANDTATNTNKSSQQGFTVANQIPTVSAPEINDTTPKTNDLISCNGGTFSDNDAEDNTEQERYFKWYDTDVEISGQTSQTLDLSVSGLNKGDVIKCSVRVYDGYDNSTWTNSSNTATIDNTAPTITNPQTTVSWNANDSTYYYDYEATDPDTGDSLTWYDNTTLFDINSETGVISDIPTENEAGTYIIRINVSDGTINATNDFTYTINDVTYPQVNIIYPVNNTDYTVNVSQLNYTYTETNPHKCWWSNSSGAWNFSPQTCGANWTELTI